MDDLIDVMIDVMIDLMIDVMIDVMIDQTGLWSLCRPSKDLTPRTVLLSPAGSSCSHKPTVSGGQ